MQCASCRFENMPGVGECGRCGSPLGLQTLAVDVHPPRASAWSKRLRRWIPFRPAYYEMRDAGRAARQSDWFQDVLRGVTPATPLGVLVRLVVPGWAHFYLGERILGRAFLGIYLALLLLSFLFYGSTPGSMFLGLAFSVHVAACISILRLGGVRVWAFGYGVFLVFGLLFVGVYLPVGWLVSQIVTPARLQLDAPPLAAGDVLLYSPLLNRYYVPRPGDVILYNFPGEFRYPLPPPRHGYIIIPAGAHVDRILAGPGDRIQWKDGRLTVNDEPSPLQPLNPESRTPSLALTVPAGRYLILPTAGPAIPDELPEQQWQNLCLVSASAIQGRVLLRSYPLTRLRRFP